MNTYAYVFSCTCMCVCVCVFECVRVFACLCVCAFTWEYMCFRTCVQCTHVFSYTRTHVYIHVLIHIYTSCISIELRPLPLQKNTCIYIHM